MPDGRFMARARCTSLSERTVTCSNESLLLDSRQFTVDITEHRLWHMLEVWN
jgi:hypothetical protein